jgi:hypothetical protein
LTFHGKSAYHHSHLPVGGGSSSSETSICRISNVGQRFARLFGKEWTMPLFEVETENHILITWAEDGDAASAVVSEAYPQEHVIRLTKRPRDTWVISKSALGITGKMDPCHTARDCLSKAEGDKVHAIRLYMHETGSDLEQARKAIESNMVMGW